MTYGLKLLLKYLLILFNFFGLIIRQKPTPQLKVLSISLSDIPFLWSHLKILDVFICSKFISAVKLFGITLLILLTLELHKDFKWQYHPIYPTLKQNLRPTTLKTFLLRKATLLTTNTKH